MADFRSDKRRKKENSEGGIPGWVHLVVLGLIVALIAFGAIKLVKWNKGRELEQVEVDASEYEVERLDQIFLLPSEKREGHEDDGKETILVLGNDAITYDMSEDGVCAQIADKTGAEVINAGFSGSTMALASPEGEGDYYDGLSFYSIAKGLTEGNVQSIVDSTWGLGDNTMQEQAEKLATLDMNTVDTLVIYYDATDYIKLRPGMNPGNPMDPMTYMGALDSGIKMIQEKYPFIRIVCMSFTFCYAYDSDGVLKNGDRVDFGNGKLTTYLQHMIDTCGETGVSFVDNYYGTIDEGNSADYLLDNIHVNKDANKVIATHFAEVIYG
ncbi:SGNH/GDSL hydrolase family protein [Butyrivibrio sp. FC2001]|jgi:hypothetical protein|uniref:SGNH/GDSL hydrolase family protein n=1 Tax=Butyrivibrio sp. FC2001 TaxID=1280671 RepID=UPI00041FE337|nr:hypothetical protein [Butyrivibrio sp. FC2001]MCR5342212.1 hypothetical protein [Butyrivibrio sp.]